MMAQAQDNWHEANKSYLMAALAELAERLGQRAKIVAGSAELETGATPARVAFARAASELASSPPALDVLCRTFGLSPFERDLLLLCAGVELDSGFAVSCGEAPSDSSSKFPNFSLALAALSGAHWSAITPAGPLRRWRLIEVASGGPLTQCTLKIDERVLHYLAGVQHLDERLAGIIEPEVPSQTLAASHSEFAVRIARLWARSAEAERLPAIQLTGGAADVNRSIAVEACRQVGLRLSSMQAQFAPVSPGELDGLTRLWERESALAESALLIECHNLDSTDSVREKAVMHLIEKLRGPVLLSGNERRPAWRRPLINFHIKGPTPAEQRSAWVEQLGALAGTLNGQIGELVSQFNLPLRAIRSSVAEAAVVADSSNESGETPSEAGQRLWDACRVQSRARLEDLAQRIEPAAGWNDIVLPELQLRILREIAIHVRRRALVYEGWGFGTKGERGLGISALFAGASGTGKTMAAEVLAGHLRLDLFRIDLSQVVNKYIGETEKNLRRVFDAAEESGAILLFDEADALFGKRSEVKDSHDRYANIEVSYLLQRMETYRGLAILTTNLKEALDSAFMRRIRFIIQFPFPDATNRREIWRRVFPDEAPREGLDVDKLSRLNVAGGNIRNIALNAAFLAADAGEPVRMGHLLKAATAEYVKIGKPLSDAETGGWV
ncbi:MAG TPA: ATP-binding protein [Blastocatellia bacterium]|nr:ATP-binding protein [Blastocatellia bacterium]